MPSICRTVLVLIAAFAVATAEDKPKTSHHLILGVPFVGWGEAAGLEYKDRSIINPALPAAQGMVLQYWGENLITIAHDRSDWKSEIGHVDDLDSIKRYIDRDIPVIVNPALTPVAHRLYITLALWAALKGPKLPGKDWPSGVLGPMLGLDELMELEKKWKISANDSVELASRVVVGYDDQRRVLILHDPSFGPAWEVSYHDFDRMWTFDHRKRWAWYPADFTERLARKRAAEPYPLRSPDHQAAVHYVYGYALESLERLAEAESELRAGLALPGISRNYQHLLTFELASVHAAMGRSQEAIVEARRAADLFPDHYRPWTFLHRQLSCCDRQAAVEAEKKAKEACSQGAQRKVAQTLAYDFYIVGCTGVKLGWGTL